MFLCFVQKKKKRELELDILMNMLVITEWFKFGLEPLRIFFNRFGS